MHYDPAIFTRVGSLQEAKRIILTDERELTTDERWERETPHICDIIEQEIDIRKESVVLDYGCGVGRIAKELIKRHGCYVIGADIAPNMQALAISYVASERFVACHPRALPLLNVKADIVISVWVLQHVENLSIEIGRIKQAMTARSNLFVVNERGSRFVPTSKGWANDKIDVSAELKAEFECLSEGHLSPHVVGDEQSQRTFWLTLQG